MSNTQYHYRSMTEARLFAGAALLAVVASVAVAPLLWRDGGSAQLVAALIVVVAAVLLVLAVQRAPQAGVSFELAARHRFQGVCRQKGLTAKDGNGKQVYPRIGRLVGGRESFTARVWPLVGQSVADWERAADAFALAYGVTSTRFTHAGRGAISVAVGHQKIAAHEFVSHEGAALAAPSWRQWLATVDVAVGEDGRAFGLPLINSHILIAGITGAGKGSVVWSLILRLLPAYRAGVVRFWGFDPKRMELSIGRQLFGENYASDPESIVLLLERAHDEMQARADLLAGVVRKFEPSPECPMHVLVIDELGYVSALLNDRKLKERAERALSALLVLGRASGFVVVGALQDPRKETLSFRDLFPVRVAMRLSKPMVDLVLGTGMYEAGAQCDLIPHGDEGAGVAFVVDEATAAPLCVRMSWCSDDAIRAAVGVSSIGQPAAQPVLPEPAAAPLHRLYVVNE